MAELVKQSQQLQQQDPQAATAKVPQDLIAAVADQSQGATAGANAVVSEQAIQKLIESGQAEGATPEQAAALAASLTPEQLGQL